jgi:AraC-like DNA-binding protein
VGGEPPRGVEPWTYALRESRADALRRLAAPIARPRPRTVPNELGEQAPSCQPSCQRRFASEIHVSVRALQSAFARSQSLSPMRYLRDVRLRRIHADLLDADPQRTTVTAVAARWGLRAPAGTSPPGTARSSANPRQAPCSADREPKTVVGVSDRGPLRLPGQVRRGLGADSDRCGGSTPNEASTCRATSAPGPSVLEHLADECQCPADHRCYPRGLLSQAGLGGRRTVRSVFPCSRSRRRSSSLLHPAVRDLAPSCSRQCCGESNHTDGRKTRTLTRTIRLLPSLATVADGRCAGGAPRPP